MTANITDAEYQELVEHAESLPQSERDSAAKESVAKVMSRLEEENKLLPEKIEEAKSLAKKYGSNGHIPCVFSAMQLDGKVHVGVCFTKSDAKVGDTFHYDHGAGIHKNNDAEILWIFESNQ